MAPGGQPGGGCDDGLVRLRAVRQVKGYSVDVADSLKEGFHISGTSGGSVPVRGSLLPLSRVYVSLDGGGLILVAADSMSERRPG